MPGTGHKSIAQDCMQVLRIFVSETRQKRSQKYLVSESQGAPIYFVLGTIFNLFWRILMTLGKFQLL